MEEQPFSFSPFVKLAVRDLGRADPVDGAAGFAWRPRGTAAEAPSMLIKWVHLQGTLTERLPGQPNAFVVDDGTGAVRVELRRDKRSGAPVPACAEAAGAADGALVLVQGALVLGEDDAHAIEATRVVNLSHPESQCGTDGGGALAEAKRQLWQLELREAAALYPHLCAREAAARRAAQPAAC